MTQAFQLKHRPRGYRSTNHETIGSDLLAVVRSLKLPQITLGKEITDRISVLEPTGWYPIGMLLEAMERVDAKLGIDGLRQMGRLIFKMSHEAHGLPPSARDLFHGFDRMYRSANRGNDIGGWRVAHFGPGVCHLEKTTPHHCGMEEGIVTAAMQANRTPATVVQEQCIRKGADHCLFVISSFIIDQRWSQ